MGSCHGSGAAGETRCRCGRQKRRRRTGRVGGARRSGRRGDRDRALDVGSGDHAEVRPSLGEGAEEHAIIAGAVDAAYANEPRLRRLTHFRELVAGSRRPQPGDLASRLDAWIAAGPDGGTGGEYGWLFDNQAVSAGQGAQDRLDLSARVLGFDMTALLETPRLRTPVMMYLFHRIEELLDGSPTMILIDEGWKALDDDVFAARIRDWLKTLRKRNALLGFATQSARDALDSRIATALVEQTATMVFMPNARARPEDYCDGFGLTAHELIKKLLHTILPDNAALVQVGKFRFL